MKVSVVITTYNRERYVVEAVESVLRQTLDDRELIVVDDGSTDDTQGVLAPYLNRISYVRTRHRGPAHARNVGLELAQGEYVCLLDSDDRCHPARLALQAAVLDARPDVSLVCTECSAFDDTGRWEEFHLRDYHHSAFRRRGITYSSLFGEARPVEDIRGAEAALRMELSWRGRQMYVGEIFDAYLLNIVIIAVSVMFRRSLLERTGLQRSRFGLFHDLEFALRLSRGQRTAFLDLPLYLIRYHPNQISTTVGPRAHWIMIRKQQDLLRVLRVHGVQDRSYYDGHRAAVDRQVARLCRAVAVPMLGFDRGTRHQRRCLPRRARAYLKTAAAVGQPQRLLWWSSFTPGVVRRALMKLDQVLDRRRPAP